MPRNASTATTRPITSLNSLRRFHTPTPGLLPHLLLLPGCALPTPRCPSRRHKELLGPTSESGLRSLGITLAINVAYSMINKKLDNW